jgi:LPPG:FO 2-phospho-L-lactate transferase
LLAALAASDLAGVIIAPSNPWLSTGPFLAIEPLREALAACGAPIVAVSPIVHGAAIKGPTAKIMGELGLEVSALAVARRYADLIDGFLIDDQDADLAPAVRELGLACATAQTVMTTEADKIAVAREALGFVDALGAAAKVRHAAL